MCGILAIVSECAPVTSEILERSLRSLSHRGPDGAGYWIAADGRAGLGQARLSIMDVSRFDQPISNEDGSCRAVVNGEFYGFESIRQALQSRGHRFRTLCDSEIVLHLYEDLGERCLEELRGEFAFILWDERKRKLLAARDRFGIKPLFYAEIGNVLYLGSEAKALFAAGVPARWDRRSVFQNMFLCADQQATVFQGVKQVPPGHYLLASSGPHRLIQYWDIDYPVKKIRRSNKSESGYIEEFQSRIVESVRMRLRSDVRVGCYLSGGVDSSSVLGIANAYSDDAIPAFSVSFDHPDFDEVATARSTAAYTGAPFTAVAATQSDCADHFADAVWAGEMIHFNGHGAARFLLSREVQRSGYKVVLAGEGADELVAGYDFSYEALQRSTAPTGKLQSWTRLLKALFRRQTETDRFIAKVSPWLGRMCRMLGVTPDLLQVLANKLATLEGLLHSGFAHDFRDRDPYGEFIGSFNRRASLAGREPVHQLLYIWMKSVFVNYVLGAERIDMAHAVEVRLPFLDHKLFEFARSIPPALLLKNGRRKYILREAVKPFVTENVYRGHKQPFFAPPSTVGRGNRLHELLQDTLRGPQFAAVPFFDRTAVTALLDGLENSDESKRAGMDPLLFMLASITILQTSYRLQL
jgi:asparagine synthase (glutamine-hydrolysing)